MLLSFVCWLRTNMSRSFVGTVFDHLSYEMERGMTTAKGITFAHYRCQTKVCHAEGWALYQTPAYGIFYKGGPMLRYFGDFLDFTAAGLTSLLTQDNHAAAVKLLAKRQKEAVFKA